MTKLGMSSTAYQLGVVTCIPKRVIGSLPACARTISEVDMLPAVMNTATKDRPIATSYEIIWALERSPPNSG
jgi:hypothetical protein